MHSLLILGLLLLLPTLAVAEEKPGTKRVQPIAVVKLERGGAVSYDKEIEPILMRKCQSCHGGKTKEGELDLSTYESLLKGGKRGRALVAGSASASRLILLAGRTGRPFMPPKDKEPLSPEELAVFKLWIDQGAQPPATARPPIAVVLGQLPALVHPVRAIAVSPDKTLIVAGRGNQIHLFDAVSGAYKRSLVDPHLTTTDKSPVQAAHLSIVEALAFSPDGQLLASASYQEVALWDTKTGALRTRLTGFADRVMALSFSPNGQLLATGGGAPTQDGEIKIFAVATGKVIMDIKNGHSDTVFGVAFSPDGTRLATCAADKFVKVFEVPSGNLVKAFEGHSHHVLDVGWKADGKLLASAGADNLIKVWDYATGEQVRTIVGHDKQITRLSFIGKTPQIVTCSGDRTVRFWNVDNGGNVRNFGGNSDFLYAVAVSADGAIVAAGGEEGIIRLYNGNNGQMVKELSPPTAPAPSKK